MTPVVLLHAFPYGPDMWSDQLQALAPYPLLVPDYLGMPLEDAAAEVVQQMHHRGWDQAVMVGLSMGGYTLFRLLERWPHTVTALVLADTRATPDTPQGKATRNAQIQRIAQEGTAWLPEALLPLHLGNTTRQTQPQTVEKVRQMLLQANGPKVMSSLAALRDRFDATPLLPSIAVPTLIVRGEEDQLMTPEDTRVLLEGILLARMVAIPDAGHMSNLENPQAFNDALLHFLRTL